MKENFFYRKAIALTFDIDWAEERIIKYTVDILKREGLKATFFATHSSELLKSLDNEMFEIGIHPRFEDLNDIATQIQRLKEIYPKAIGARSHSVICGGPFIAEFTRAGLKYDSNVLLPKLANIRPFFHSSGLFRIPFFWADDANLDYGDPFDPKILPLKEKGLKVFLFHPIHIWLNSDSQNAHKRPIPKNSASDNKKEGIRTFLFRLIEIIKREGYQTYRTEELYYASV
jgi:hypothetical protein